LSRVTQNGLMDISGACAMNIWWDSVKEKMSQVHLQNVH